MKEKELPLIIEVLKFVSIEMVISIHKYMVKVNHDEVLHELRSQVLPHLKLLANRSKGGAVPLEIVPFSNGDDPTQPPSLCHEIPHWVSCQPSPTGSKSTSYQAGMKGDLEEDGWGTTVRC
ncbi:hypothetical protein EDB85DRAFT_1904859 [Lactarius pseudohatsudake]|nr:hypothetical protein EDB85DRAFT_1904859 [Lactarius pseudohatsudake]